MKAEWRALLALAHDIAACAAAWMGAHWLRFNMELPEPHLSSALTALAFVVPLHAAVFLGFGLYRGIWRYASLPDLRRIINAALMAAIVVPAALLMLQISVPRSVLVMSPALLIMIMGGSRLAYRAWKERRFARLILTARETVLVLGADDAAASLVKDLARSAQWHVVGILDDDRAKQGRELHDVKVVGPMDEVASWASRLGARHAIVAMPEASHVVRRRAVELAAAAGLKVLTVPSFDDLLSGRVTISQVRHVELDDLLGRDPVVLDTAGLRNWLTGRTVLVTGAGGSIGAELARQIARFGPARLILFELNEFALYNVEREFADQPGSPPFVCTIGDVKDRARVSQVLGACRPSVIFHAAAYKHVPLMESENAWQAVLNNVLGTQIIAEAAIAHGVEKFVLISTDKAVNPANVMGATKRLAEMVCQALQPPVGPRFVIVRFGNVLGSTGSVIPRFREQIAKGGPLTVTHPDITRYFMSIPEAVQLVLQAGLMGDGGEIFVLDMGEPVRIADLARAMIRLSGFSESDIRIDFTGLRPGEKLYEELLAVDENSLPTPHRKLRIARARTADGAWLAELSRWLARDTPLDDGEARAGLARWVPEYSARL